MVIAQAERRIGDCDRVRFEAGRGPSIEGVGGLRLLAALVQGAEGGAGRDASGVPPRGGRIVSHSDEGACHALRASAKRFIQLRSGWLRDGQEERRAARGACKTGHTHKPCYRKKEEGECREILPAWRCQRGTFSRARVQPDPRDV